MTKISCLIIFLFSSKVTFACITCNKMIREGIWNSTFYPNLFSMLSAFVVLTIIVAILSRITTNNHRKKILANPGIKLLSPIPLTTASIVMGIGLGGFMDGIVLHQLLQWHEMLSNKIPATDYVGKSVNMFWDGIFHFFCLMVVLTGVVLMWKLLRKKDVDHSGKLLGGGLLIGWGLFNIVEGIINHHLLKLHNVVELSLNHDTGNFAFLGISVFMLIIGFVLINRHSLKYNKLQSLKDS